MLLWDGENYWQRRWAENFQQAGQARATILTAFDNLTRCPGRKTSYKLPRVQPVQ